MPTRFVVVNGLRLALLAIFIITSSQAIKAIALGGLIATLVIDYRAYKREKREIEEAENPDLHVPMPPKRARDRS